ncbi:MAG: hypothetical protein IT435_02635 [Phycisphaerales bacterium]|nr:hypothetical protein [Phycisphaerales bacterium]
MNKSPSNRDFDPMPRRGFQEADIVRIPGSDDLYRIVGFLDDRTAKMNGAAKVVSGVGTGLCDTSQLILMSRPNRDGLRVSDLNPYSRQHLDCIRGVLTTMPGGGNAGFQTIVRTDDDPLEEVLARLAWNLEKLARVNKITFDSYERDRLDLQQRRVDEAAIKRFLARVMGT